MAENENLASILVKSSLISIFTNSPIGYFSKFANELLFYPLLRQGTKFGYGLYPNHLAKVSPLNSIANPPLLHGFQRIKMTKTIPETVLPIKSIPTKVIRVGEVKKCVKIS